MYITLIICITVVILAWLITRTIQKSVETKWKVISDKFEDFLDIFETISDTTN